VLGLRRSAAQRLGFVGRPVSWSEIAQGCRTFAASRPEAVRGVPVFPVLFGESDTGEMQEVAARTGGRTFDARSGSLASAFTEIRGYV
jgi:Ca-activated chloride channel family protein